jgi:hypothetical protein
MPNLGILSHKMSVIISNKYLKFEEHTLRNKKVIVKITFFNLNSYMGIKMNTMCARVMNLVTHHMCNDKRHIFEVCD